jgi:MarR-like DNA-binding transcriptional regulator SgrR of sgrS sRNA
MVKKINDIHLRSAEILKMGKLGNTTFAEIAEAWGCSTENIARYLHRLQERENYAYIVDGKGCFRVFQDFK